MSKNFQSGLLILFPLSIVSCLSVGEIQSAHSMHLVVPPFSVIVPAIRIIIFSFTVSLTVLLLSLVPRPVRVIFDHLV